MAWQMYDEVIALRIAWRGRKRGHYNKQLVEELLKKPDLLDAKRQQLMLKRKLRELVNGKV
jgi:hypothetical protein